MAATTISRTTFTDDTGDGISGTIWDSSIIGTSLYDPIDALIANDIEFGGTVKALLFHANRDDTTQVNCLIENNDNVAGQNIGSLVFKALDSGGAAQEYAGIRGTVSGPTAGSERGALKLEAALGATIAARMTIVGDNVGIGTETFGGSASKVLAIANGTQATAVADQIHLASEDLSAGNTLLSIRTEGGGCFSAGTPAAATGSVAIKVDGTVYHFTVSTTAAA